MRHLRHILPALALVTATWATQGAACDKDKATSASAAGKASACSAEMAAQCTPEMAAACKAMGMKTADGKSCSAAKTSAKNASASGCPYMNSSAKSAAYDHCSAAKSAAVTASANGCASKTSAASTAAYDHCSAAKGAAVTASANGCASKTSAASTAAYDHCSAAKSAAVTASANGCASKTSAAGSGDACSAKGKTMAMSAGSSCSGSGMANVAGRGTHADCDACADMAHCTEELEAAGARTQVVPLKNGVMFVYTAESPGKVNAVQSAMSRRSERLAQIVSSGDKAHLCPECKTFRGAMASGKMIREVVNIEGGALTLMTSDDPALVAKIHAMVDSHKNGRAKI